MSNKEIAELKDQLFGVARDSIQSYKKACRYESKKYLKKVTQFSRVAEALTRDLLLEKITEKEYLSGLHNISLAMRSYLVARGYRQSRAQLHTLIKTLRRIAAIAAFFFKSVFA